MQYINEKNKNKKKKKCRKGYLEYKILFRLYADFIVLLS